MSRECRSTRRCVLLIALAVVAAFLGLSGRSRYEVAPSFLSTQASAPARSSSALLMVPRAGRGAIEGVARRQGCTAMQAVGVLFATQTGNTEGVAGKIAEAA